jgi:hypothetical protein
MPARRLAGRRTRSFRITAVVDRARSSRLRPDQAIDESRILRKICFKNSENPGGSPFTSGTKLVELQILDFSAAFLCFKMDCYPFKKSHFFQSIFSNFEPQHSTMSVMSRKKKSASGVGTE